ncbi:glycosyltransferase family A protein [Brevundimonas sp. 2R-24]|uniref:Glycosyltransferase family A protein n=1 Tax=Peiella sedimenti TaxID=3061083 RepID=A0ABT8SP67_9CAUL|nr:glycosyltransferase family A protein [Caulobacteraceae bacterium XZ-24]
MTLQVHDNASWSGAQPRLSVLIPFFRDDPTRLIHALDAQGAREVELVLLDDGGEDASLTQRVRQALEAATLPIRLVVLHENAGRARGRNLLAEQARAEALLFLDSDMLPDRPDFLHRWLTLAKAPSIGVAFGGFSLLQAPRDPRFAVHRAMALRSDCLPAAERMKTPEKYVYTSNLLVRREVFDRISFAADFTGWGWEDVEWAMRAADISPIVHVDIPATHMGLDPVEALIGKYEQSAPNFARVVERHPEVIAAYPVHRAARLIRRIPGRSLVRALCKAVARLPVAPAGARAFSLRLYRAALYAEVV